MIDQKSLIAGAALAALLASAPAAFAQTAAPAPETPAAAGAPADAGTAETPAAGEAPAAPQPYTAPSQDPSAPDAAAPAPNAPAAGAAASNDASSDAAAAPASAEDAMATVQNLSPLIGDVQIVGPWTEGERSGVWRTVMMQDGGQPERYRFFLQQIEAGDGAQAIKETTEITEIAEIEGAIVGYRADEPSSENPGSLTLFFDIVPADGEISETYELHYFQGSPYMFGPATN